MDAGNGLRVLIVGDEWLIAQSLANQLTGQGSMVVGPASDVRAALDLVSTQKNGFRVADELQQRGIPFVFVTGYASCDLPQRFKNRPLLVKPVDSEVLRGVLTELTTGHQLRRSNEVL